jgi:hypothetical protein
MKRSQRWSLIFVLGLVVTGNSSTVAQTLAAVSPDTSLTVTIHVHNYAEVGDKTLLEAEKIAAGIYRKVGVETRWTPAPLAPKINQESSTDQGSLDLTDIDLNMVPRVMADRLGLPNKVMGLAPGTEPDRQVVYVFSHRVEVLAQSQVRAVFEGSIRRPATMAQVLGHAIAHEIGHLLLNLESHSATGIMRGDWDLSDLQGVGSGFLLFTSQQAEVIRTEVARRASRAGFFKAMNRCEARMIHSCNSYIPANSCSFSHPDKSPFRSKKSHPEKTTQYKRAPLLE